jgi:mRNA (guanine-N7-)-methyltransferase
VLLHYKKMAENSSQEERKKSAILRLRNYNNWVKAVLLHFNTVRGRPLLDLCCGKLGDMKKHAANHIGYLVAADLSATSITEALRRYNQTHDAHYVAKFIVANCFDERLFTGSVFPLDRWLWFSTVSCQMALHYSFSDEKSARRMVENVTDRISNYGRFVGTTLDMRELLRRLARAPGDSLSYGNEFYRVQFRDARLKAKSDSEEDVEAVIRDVVEPNPFGHAYSFSLVGAVEDLEEYLVPLKTLKALFAEKGMECDPNQTCRFNTFWTRFSQHDETSEMYERIFVEEFPGDVPQAPMSDDEWEAATVYRTFVFEKRSQLREMDGWEMNAFAGQPITREASRQGRTNLMPMRSNRQTISESDVLKVGAVAEVTDTGGAEDMDFD